MRQTLQGARRVLRQQAFRRFWLGMMISRAGDAFTLVALSWIVLGIAGPVQLGVVLMCFGLPRIVSGPVAGRLLDGARPRLLLATDNAARGLLIAAVPVLLWQHRLVVADLYGIAAASALLSAVTEVAESALVPRLVEDEQLDAANSLLAANWELAAIAGPAAAGLIVATAGAPLALLLDAGSFAVMTAICLSLPSLARPPEPAQAGPAPAHDWLGLGILLRFPAVLVITACGFGMLVFDGVATVLYPVYARTFLPAGPAGYGVLVSAAGAGALLGVLAGPGLSGRLPPSRRLAVVIAAGAPWFGLLCLAPGLAVAAVLLGLATFAWGPYYVFDRTLMQRLVPREVLSRVAGARMTISSLGFPLGSAVGGVLAGGIGVRGAMLAIACSALALGLLPLLAPALRTAGGARPAGASEDIESVIMDTAAGRGRPGPVGFDLDMTLINSRPAILASFAEVGRETGTAIDLTAVDRRLGIKLDDELAYWFPPGRIDAAAGLYRRHYLQLAERMTTILPGARESLAAVRAAGQQVIIITAKHPVSVGPSLRAVGLSADELFTLVHGPEKAEVLQRVAAIAYVGDTPPDMAAAVRAGVRAVGVTTGSFTGEDLTRAGAEVVLGSLNGFPDWYRSVADE